MNLFTFGSGAVLILLINACADHVSREAEREVGTTQPAGAGRIEGLHETDSMEMYAYPVAGDYSRFERVVIADTVVLQALARELSSDTTASSECPYDVKFFLYRDGEVFKTVYGATGDSCRYLAYVMDGRKYFTGLSASTLELVRQRKMAKD